MRQSAAGRIRIWAGHFQSYGMWLPAPRNELNQHQDN